MGKRLNWKGLKGHRTYTFEQAARLLGVHRNTVRNWVKTEGLPALTEERPFLIRGVDLREFLRARQTRRKRSLGPREMYCFGCKRPRVPDPALVEDVSDPSGPGMLRGLCSECTCLMHRRIARDQISDFVSTGASPPTGADDIKEGLTDPLEQVQTEAA
ncbi:MAG: helix-turn-helix domain-containing protein [Pseudomonadota bacterium]